MKTLAIVATIILSVSGSAMADDKAKFVEMCSSDPRAQQNHFDCNCQGNIVGGALSSDEMSRLVSFLELSKNDPQQAVTVGKDPKYAPIFQKLSSVSKEIRDKCLHSL